MFFNQSIPNSKNRGFTLLELLIVIGILAIISSVSILTINPGEYFKRGRDTQRLADLNNLHLAMTMYYTSGVSNFDLDGPNYTGSCASPGKVFISTPSGVAGPANLPSGWTYASSTSANLRKTNGTGWMPVNLDSIPSGSPLNALPIDPVNDINQALYYTYTCATSSPAGYEFNANLESRRFNKGGDDDKTSKDGGDDPNVYEVGSRLTVNPMAPVGYWAFDEGVGTTAGDSSKNGFNGTKSGGAVWQSSVYCKVGSCIQFPGNENVSVPDNNVLDITDNLTILLWFKASTLTPSGASFHAIRKWTGTADANFVHYYCGSACGSNNTMRWYANAGGTWANVSSVTSALSTNTWYFIGLTYQNGGQLYWNGSPVGSKTASGNLATNNASLAIGNDGILGENVFIIDEPRIYNRVLTAAEILHYYNTSR